MSVSLEPLFPADIPAALQIIGAHDEDDAEAAQTTYERALDGQFCIRMGGTLIGVTGFSVEECGASWLSWHYIAPEQQGKGWGDIMLRQVMVKVGETHARKMFISTSDYRESIGAPLLYGKAMALYESVGFEREVYHPDFYEKGEGMIIYGRRVRPAVARPVIPEQAAITLFGVDRIEETDSAFFVDWDECDVNQACSGDDLSMMVGNARQQGATAVFISIPSTLEGSLSGLFLQGGFRQEGILKDYYADGVNEIRYRLNP